MSAYHEILSNEEHRWSYMTEEQLARRVKKITKPQKLDCFINMAFLKGNDYLRYLAIERQVDLGLIAQAKKGMPSNVGKIRSAIKKKWDTEKEKEIDERFLNF